MPTLAYAKRFSKRLQAILFVPICLTIIASLYVVLLIHSATPGVQVSAPKIWPAAVHGLHHDQRCTLLMFAHPRCPCTSASLEEFARLMAHFDHQVDAYVLFLHPAGQFSDLEKSSTWNDAAAIPGVTALSDDDGKIAAQFGACTSGETYLYGPRAELIYSGGITPARGHVGESFGSDCIQQALLRQHTSKPQCSMVFGCSLLDTKKNLLLE